MPEFSLPMPFERLPATPPALPAPNKVVEVASKVMFEIPAEAANKALDALNEFALEQGLPTLPALPEFALPALPGSSARSVSGEVIQESWVPREIEEVQVSEAPAEKQVERLWVPRE